MEFKVRITKEPNDNDILVYSKKLKAFRPVNKYLYFKEVQKEIKELNVKDEKRKKDLGAVTTVVKDLIKGA